MSGLYQIIFLSYVARSGSTFLAQTISRHTRDILVLPEVKFLEILVGEGSARISKSTTRQVLHLLKNDPRWNNLMISDDRFESITSDCQDIASIVFSICDDLVARSNIKPKYILLKNSTIVWQYDEIQKVLGENVIIHLIRDIRGSTSSRLRSDISFKKDDQINDRRSVVQLAKYWTEYVDRVRAIRMNGGHVIEISYEDLVQKKLDVIDDLFIRLKVQYVEKTGLELGISKREFETKHSNVYKKALESRIYGWKKELSLKEGYLIEYIGKDYLHDRYFIENLSIAQKWNYWFRGYVEYYSLLIYKIRSKVRLLRSNRNLRSILFKRYRLKIGK